MPTQLVAFARCCASTLLRLFRDAVPLLVLLTGRAHALSNEDAYRLYAEGQTRALMSCSGPFKGRQPTNSEWRDVLAEHSAFLHKWKDGLRSPEAINDKRRANLCGANLAGLEAPGVNLTGANLSAAHIGSGNLEGALLWGADLSFVSAPRAVLTRAALNTGSLYSAWLQGAKLDGTILTYVDLRGAFLLDTNMQEAPLVSPVAQPSLKRVDELLRR